jgi:hypothetical protein
MAAPFLSPASHSKDYARMRRLPQDTGTAARKARAVPSGGGTWVVQGAERRKSLKVRQVDDGYKIAILHVLTDFG